MDNTKKLELLIDQLEAKIPQGNKSKASISKGNVAWHIEHSLLVLKGIIHVLATSDPKDYQYSFNLLRIGIMTTGIIPRGRAKAPRNVRPKEDISEASLTKHVSITRSKIQELDSLSPNHFFDHPYFGNMKLEQAIKFIGIHTQHHLKIIDRIIG